MSLKYLIKFWNISTLRDTPYFGHFLGGLCYIFDAKNDGKIRIWRTNLLLKLELIEVFYLYDNP